MADWGRATGLRNAFDQYGDNYGPLVRENRLDGNSINGMVVRGGTLTTEGVWDDTDIVHVVYDEIVVTNLCTYGGLRLQSSPTESLVVKLSGADAGFTATGRPLEIDDRIGGTIQVIGTPGHPVVFTDLADDTVGAGSTPDNRTMMDTDNTPNSTGTAGAWRSIKLEEYSNDRNVAVINEAESANGRLGGRQRHSRYGGVPRPVGHRGQGRRRNAPPRIRGPRHDRAGSPRRRRRVQFHGLRRQRSCGSNSTAPPSPWTPWSSCSTRTGT